jgi:hypothetical protein
MGCLDGEWDAPYLFLYSQWVGFTGGMLINLYLRFPSLLQGI